MLRFSYFARNLFSIFIFVLALVSCSDDGEVVEPEKAYLDVEFAGVTSTTQVQAALNFVGATDLIDEVKYNYEYFTFTYKSGFQGNNLVASGLLALPTTEDEVALMSVHHGTIVADDEAPSVNVEDNFIFLAAASLGYAVILPDFIGFGTTSEILHPYYDITSSGEVVRDMIIAAQVYLKDNFINFNNELYLAGYSQGGYVTFAAQKLIEENPIEGINLIASAPASGAYDLIDMKDYFFSLPPDPYQQPFYIGYIVHNYNIHYGWDQPLTDFFNEPYATRIPSLYDGSLNGSQINGQLTNNIDDLMTEDVLENFDTDPRFSNLKDAMMANSLVDWRPEIPTRMYHGTADVTVPYSNTEVSFEKLKENGGNVELVPLEGKNHATGTIPYAESFLLWFEEFRN